MAEESFGDRIKKVRKAKRLSQEHFAEALGISTRTVIRWEMNKELPNLGNQQRLIEQFDFKEEDFQRSSPLQETPPSLSQGENAPLSSIPSPEEAESPPVVSELEQMLPPKEDFKMYCGRRIYRGVSKETYVTVNGRALPHFNRNKRDPEKQIIYEWGYGGAGPRELAQSMLADYLGEQYPDNKYLDLYDSNALLFGMLFKEEVIAGLPSEAHGIVDDYWQITSPEIRRWFYSLEAEGITRTSLLNNIYGEKVLKLLEKERSGKVS